jgi:hypothetical protein
MDVKIQDQNIVDLVFENRDIIHFEFVPEGNTVNQTIYVEVTKRLVDVMRCKRGDLWRDHSLILHHDNEPAQSLLRASQIFARKRHLCLDSMQSVLVCLIFSHVLKEVSIVFGSTRLN